MKRYPFTPDYSVPPGETLSETLLALGLTRAEVAQRLGVTSKYLQQIIEGDSEISDQMAHLLYGVTGVPEGMWRNLEKNYRKFSETSSEKTSAE